MADTGFIQYLSEEFKARQGRNPSYSLRAFARSLEVSPAQLSQILSGKRNLTLKTIHQISSRLSLSPLEKENFLKTWSTQKETQEVKQKRTLLDDEFKLIADWYHFAILSLAQLKDSTINSMWIAERLGISVWQAKEAVQRMQRMGILGPGPKLEQISEPLSVVSDVPSDAIRGYHQKILAKAQEQLDLVPVEERDYSALTFSVSKKNIKRYRNLIEKFQDDLNKVAKATADDDIYVFSCQLFPLQQSSERKSK
jgi:uncharacterized protein (TIGR02147 family)